jgi:hypothetical protein
MRLVRGPTVAVGDADEVAPAAGIVDEVVPAAADVDEAVMAVAVNVATDN